MPNNLEASIDIAAAPEKVWSVLADLRRMPEFSPTTWKVLALGGVRVGTFTVNVNKDGWRVWPTSSRIVAFEPNKTLAFRMNENRTVWRYELTATAQGTRVVETRVVDPKGIPAPVRAMINTAMGNEQEFEAALVAGMQETLARVKTAAER
ncbi:polyketide cyclase [Nocardia mangyaensis]|uniref:Polyketide cyclase n=1 Tax=Nocardia mangyaensis TaxID=2213200 RepID=A0A1J0W3L8_9NOCA|nr:SRPBCC family protein [Nocardia mangyaensis]APE38866.1 polyketide cyclase [Nocardia mangyaensis]